MAEFIAIQNAPSGSIFEINTRTYILGTNDMFDQTILFSGRPNKIAESILTSDSMVNGLLSEIVLQERHLMQSL